MAGNRTFEKMMSPFLCLLLVTAVLCDKKLNLDDIERDQLRSEITDSKKSTVETLRTDESKYSAKAEASQSQSQQQQQQHQQQQYHGPTTPPKELGNQVGDYAELQSYESFKYSPQDYNQAKYPENDDTSTYLHQQSSILINPADQQQQQQQYYVQKGRSNSPSDYATILQQQQYYQQQQQQLNQREVLVGNQHQSVQQKAAAQKYVDGNDDKDTYYINIPMNQLLAYYQNYELIQPKGKNVEQQISHPVDAPLFTPNQVHSPTKVTYQPEYVSTYPKHTQAVFTKSPKSPATNHASSSDTSSASAHHLSTAGISQQYAAPIGIIMNPAYFTTAYQPQKYEYSVTQQQQQQQHQQQHQQQPQYVHQQQQQQQFVDENQSSAYSDIYNTPTTSYVHDNSLHEQQQQQQQQQYYVPAALAEQLMTQILQQAGIQTTPDVVHQTVKQEVYEPLQHNFAPPQYQAQKFRGSQEVTHLVPVASENEGFPSSKPIYISSASSFTSSKPKTLLDSYVPSHVIAAQDVNRYRERPIKLESGFLPSKINFIRSYKKRKTE